MIVLNSLLGVAAFVLLLFIIGETKPAPISKEKRQACTVAFVAVVLLIIALNTVM